MHRVILLILLFTSPQALSCMSCDDHPEMDGCQACEVNLVELTTEQGEIYLPQDFTSASKTGFVTFTFNLKPGKKPQNIEIVDFQPQNLPKGYFNQLIKSSKYSVDTVVPCVPKHRFKVTFEFPIK